MRRTATSLFALLLLVSGCDEPEELQAGDSSVFPGPGLAGGGSTAGAPGTAGGAASPGGLVGGPSTGGPGAATGGLAGTVGGAQDAGVALPGGGLPGLAGGGQPGPTGGGPGPGPTPDGGPALTGGTQGGTGDGGSSGPGPSVAGPEPTIPKPNMPCPVFMSGTTTFMGLSVEIYAGPKSTGKKGPLVFHWHGTGGNGKQATMGFGASGAGAGIPPEMVAEIMAEGGIIISPTDNETVREGTDVTVILGVWYTPGDLKMADVFAACAVENHNIDPRRIYTTGCSAGGLMSGVMAFHRSSYLAASVPNSGGVVDLPGMTTFEDMHTPALMTMHGLMGTDWVIVDFHETSAAAANAMAAKGGFVVNCDHGGGHCAAPAPLKLAMWQFMKDHPFGVSPEPYANGLPASFPSYCKIIKR